MYKAYILKHNNEETIVSTSTFKKLITGIEKSRDLWPPLYCVSCKQNCFVSGLFTASDYLPRFSHKHEPDNPELCPLSSKTKRFKPLSRLDSNLERAKQVKKSFFEFESLKKAYLICRKLRGGKGKLTQDEFIKMVKVADSIGIWGYSYMSEWGIPLLLMLMSNHETPNGGSSFFYELRKDRSDINENWWTHNVRLEAHWVSDGKKIVARKDKNPSFYLTLPFEKKIGENILSKENLAWYGQDKLKIIWSFYDKYGTDGNF